MKAKFVKEKNRIYFKDEDGLDWDETTLQELIKIIKLKKELDEYMDYYKKRFD